VKWIVVAIALAGASSARAENAKPEPPWYPRISIGGGLGLWIGDVGVLTPTGATLQLAGDVEITRMLHVRATVEHAFLTARDEILTAPLHVGIDGVALAVVHPLFGFDPTDIRVGGDMHVLAGVEYERITFAGTAPIRRYEAVVGFGGSIVVFDKQTHTRPSQQIDYGVRMMFGRAPDPGKLPAGCDGPCDMATKTAPYDHTVIMELGWRYGR
jgi:hypothetical protein